MNKIFDKFVILFAIFGAIVGFSVLIIIAIHGLG